ncbi:MAG: hypothetical protein BMS9Abin05_1867 [Rhodothermia bacterium]|nr:MAG: hypothetical protein BMS9Abin05_1867 [Rhodothermia bacterium]
MRSFSVVPVALGFVVILFLVQTAIAQDTIITDRPDFTESGVSVPKGKVQIEGGFSLVDYGGISVFSLPETIVRIGMKDGLELRIGIPDYEDWEFVSGIGDLKVGAKLEIDDLLDGWETAAVATLELPTGDDGIGSDHLSVDVLLAGGTGLNDIYSFGSQVSVSLSGTDNGVDLEIGGTAVVSRSIAESLSSFLELAASIPDIGEMELILHSGMTYLVQETMQLDVHLGIGLTKESPDTLFGAGLSVIL